MCVYDPCGVSCTCCLYLDQREARHKPRVGNGDVCCGLLQSRSQFRWNWNGVVQRTLVEEHLPDLSRGQTYLLLADFVWMVYAPSIEPILILFAVDAGDKHFLRYNSEHRVRRS